MAVTGKAPWTTYVMAVLTLGVPTATSMMVRQRIHVTGMTDGVHRGTHQHNASNTQAAAVVTTATATCTSAWTNQHACAPVTTTGIQVVCPGAYWYCPSDAEFCGFEQGNGRWMTTTTLSGSGTLAVDFANTQGHYRAELYHNGNLIHSLTGQGTRETVSVDFQDGDTLALGEWHGIVALYSITCPNQATASAQGDPHLQNVHGERFDLMIPGNHVLINIPRGERAENTLLRVQAFARRLGGQCEDIYFTEVNVTGSWANAQNAGGLHYDSQGNASDISNWITLGMVDVKVVHAHTATGTKYLNVYIKHLGRAGFDVGGLLGEDDHVAVSTPPSGCLRHASLDISRGHPYSRNSSAVSTAEATLA